MGRKKQSDCTPEQAEAYRQYFKTKQRECRARKTFRDQLAYCYEEVELMAHEMNDQLDIHEIGLGLL